MRPTFFHRGFRRWFFALTAASALVIAAGGAQGTDADGDEIPDEFEAATERNVAVATYPHVAPYGVSITSQSVGAPVDDKFRLRYEAGGFDVDYLPDAASGRVASSFNLEVGAVVEWIDGIPMGVVDDGEVTRVLPLGSDQFGAIPVVWKNWSDVDGGSVDEFTIRSTNAEITLVLVIAQRFYRVSGDKVLTPMEAKLEIHLNHSMTNTNARAGLELFVETDDDMAFGNVPWDVVQQYSVDESWINVTGGGDTPATVFFSWSNEATVDGAAGAVQKTPPEGSSGSYRMLVLYPQSPTARPAVVHVASLGVVSAAFADLIRPATLPGDAVVFGASLVGVAAVVGGTMVLAKRSRRKD